jgi:hypothetical protein
MRCSRPNCSRCCAPGGARDAAAPPRVPSLEAFGRRPSALPATSRPAGIRNPSQLPPSGPAIVASAARGEATETALNPTSSILTAEIRPIADVAGDGPGWLRVAATRRHSGERRPQPRGARRLTAGDSQGAGFGLTEIRWRVQPPYWTIRISGEWSGSRGARAVVEARSPQENQPREARHVDDRVLHRRAARSA